MIELKGICKLYSQGSSTINVLKDIDLTVENGEYVSIMGRSGSGKSTLMQIIGCLDSQTSGAYLLDNKIISEKSEKELALLRNDYIGFVFQNFNLFPDLTALENVTVPLIYKGTHFRDRRNISSQLLSDLGLEVFKNHKPSELSGGQKQRVAIARALANKPKIILADEPTGALDSKTSIEVMRIFKRLNEEGTTCIIVTHDPNIAAQTKRSIVLNDGQIVDDKRRN
ncbi:ABC transporter ATP-binding protein [Cytobacillus firmus]|uniref:ABC transporter ATP-binding protein n=1 Tax=Cytobacillus firmus TaxID=1399 RepID=UPI0024C2085C|nr:ABC transporter ATP-binding protein [Cytobacillus firmus]WHY36781.1 ABC transporter ATP-binding protein [Cytobacillus firmus]